MASVVVVGGGVAGLACAFRLRRAGHDVEVLERESEAGGRMRSESRDGFVVERGAQFVASGYRNLHTLVSALDLASAVRPLARSSHAILRRGRLCPADPGSLRGLLASRGLSAGAKLRLAGLAATLWRRRRHLDPYHPERAAVLDGEDMAVGFARTVGPENLEYLFAPAFSSTFDCEPEDLSWAFALLALRLAAEGRRLQSFAGGNGRFTRALAARVPVRVGCQVSAVESETSGVRVRYRARGREGRAIADAAVVAVPGTEVVELCPKLTPTERGFFEQVRYGRGIVVHLLLDAPPANLSHYGVSFPKSEALDLYGLAVDHHKEGAAPAGAGLVNAALTARAAARMWQAPDQAIADLVVSNLARTPIGRLSPSDCVVHRWSPMLPQFAPGYLHRLASFLSRVDRSPRLAFAGDYLVGPYVEGAVTSGIRAATEIVRNF